MDCLRKAGRRARYDRIVLYKTLSPCMMCAGTIVQFGIPRVVVGEARSFAGNIAFLRERGVEFAGPVEGGLAEGGEGLGRMAEPEEIFARCQELLGA